MIISGQVAEMIAPCEERMRTLIETHIASVRHDMDRAKKDMEAMADRAADRAAADVMERFCELVFNTKKPSYEQVTGLHRLLGAGKWAERGAIWLLLAVVGIAALTFVAERFDVWSGVIHERAGIPVIGQVPKQ